MLRKECLCCTCRWYWYRNFYFCGFFGMDFGFFVENVFDGAKGSGRVSSSLSLGSDIWEASGVSVVVSLWVCCFSFSCVEVFVGVGMSPDAVLLWGAFFSGSYFLPLAVRWSFFSATAKSLAICSCGYLELNNFFLIRMKWPWQHQIRAIFFNCLFLCESFFFKL